MSTQEQIEIQYVLINLKFIGLYSELLAVSFTRAITKSFSGISEDEVSHDNRTNILRSENFDSKSLWKIANTTASSNFSQYYQMFSTPKQKIYMMENYFLLQYQNI